MTVKLNDGVKHDIHKYLSKPCFVYPDGDESDSEKFSVEENIDLKVIYSGRTNGIFLINVFLNIDNSKAVEDYDESIQSVSSLGDQWESFSNEVMNVFFDRFPNRLPESDEQFKLTSVGSSLSGVLSMKVKKEHVTPRESERTSITLSLDQECEFVLPPSIDESNEQEVQRYFNEWWKENSANKNIELFDVSKSEPPSITVEK